MGFTSETSNEMNIVDRASTRIDRFSVFIFDIGIEYFAEIIGDGYRASKF